MRNNKEVIEKISKGVEHKKLREMSGEIVKMVFETRIENLVFNEKNCPQVCMKCREFKEEMINLGFEPPKSIKELYNNIINPLYLHLVRRAK